MKLKPHEEPLRSEILSGKFTILVSLWNPSCALLHPFVAVALFGFLCLGSLSIHFAKIVLIIIELLLIKSINNS